MKKNATRHITDVFLFSNVDDRKKNADLVKVMVFFCRGAYRFAWELCCCRCFNEVVTIDLSVIHYDVIECDWFTIIKELTFHPNQHVLSVEKDGSSNRAAAAVLLCLRFFFHVYDSHCHVLGDIYCFVVVQFFFFRYSLLPTYLKADTQRHCLRCTLPCTQGIQSICQITLLMLLYVGSFFLCVAYGVRTQ